VEGNSVITTRVEVRKTVARVTHQLVRQARPAAEIKTAVLLEAERGGLNPEDALAISRNILREKMAEGRLNA